MQLVGLVDQRFFHRQLLHGFVMLERIEPTATFEVIAISLTTSHASLSYYG